MSLIDDALALLAPAGSLIGSIVPDVVVSEVHQDAVAITDHPVEIGASISDHAFILPSRVEMRIGYSDATAGFVGYSKAQYEALLAILQRREPFDLFTAKRAYTSMLIETITTDTANETTSAAMIVVRLRKVLIARARGGGGAPNTAQESPQNTGSVSDTGTAQPNAFSGSDVGSNTDFLAPDQNLGLSPSGNGAGFDTMFVDGVGEIPSGLADNVDNVNPVLPDGRLGMFGQYGPNVFQGVQQF